MAGPQWVLPQIRDYDVFWTRRQKGKFVRPGKSSLVYLPAIPECSCALCIFFAIAFITLFYNYLDLSVPLHCKLLEGRDCIFVIMVPAKYLANSRCSCKFLTSTRVFFSRICSLMVTTTIFGVPAMF